MANVRSEPDLNASVIAQLKAGTLLESRQRIGDWYEISVQDAKGIGQTGYINASVVDVVGGAAPAQPPVQQPVREETRPVEPARPVLREEPPVLGSSLPRSSGGFKVMAAYGLASMSYKSTADSAEFDKYKSSLTGFAGGIGYESGGRLGFEIDLMYLPKGLRFKGLVEGVDFDVKVRLTQISVPILLKFNLVDNPGIYLLGGAEIAYVLSAKADYSLVAPDYDLDESGSEDIKENVAPLDYGLVLGGGVRLPLGPLNVFFEARYHLGLANTEKTNEGYEDVPSDSAPKTNLILILAGIRF
jgi:hypothetical protein